MKLTLAICAMLATPLCSGEPVRVSTNGVTELKTTVANHSVEVRIWMREVDIGKPGGPPEISRNSCTYSRIPCAVVETMQVALDGKAVFVPRSVFADLSDLSEIDTHLMRGGFRIVADGGDASEAYTVTIEVKSDRIVKRTLSVYHDIKHPLQVTHYYNVVVGD